MENTLDSDYVVCYRERKYTRVGKRGDLFRRTAYKRRVATIEAL